MSKIYKLVGKTVKELADGDVSPFNMDRTILKNTMYINGADIIISTVFLVLDHGFDGTPLLFETMIFRHDEETGKIDWSEIYARRHATYDDAFNEHLILMANLNDDPRRTLPCLFNEEARMDAAIYEKDFEKDLQGENE